MKDKEKFGKQVWHDIKMQLPIYIFKVMEKEGMSFNELEDITESWVKFRNEQFGDPFANKTSILEHKGNFFKFGMYGNIFSLWDNSDKILGEFHVSLNDPPTKEFLKWLDELVEEYENGYVHCSDCGRIMQEKEIAGRYFAGIYCNECWDREWAERESRETYD